MSSVVPILPGSPHSSFLNSRQLVAEWPQARIRLLSLMRPNLIQRGPSALLPGLWKSGRIGWHFRAGSH